MNQYEAHQKLIKEFELAVAKEFNDVIVLPYTVGMFRAFDNPDRIIHAGRIGVPDLFIGWDKGYCFFDAKTGKAIFNSNQLNFKARMYEVCKRDVVFKLKSVGQGIELLKGLVNAK